MDNNRRYIIARRATLYSAAANIALALIKIIGGYFGNSYALLADGIHSFSDLITDGLVIIAAKAGGQLPDKEHPYGHQRIETITAILLALILAAVAFSIAYDAIHLIFNKKQVTQPEYAIIVIAAISIGVKEWLYRYTLKLGHSIKSNLLISNAWHHRSDAFTSIIVLISVIGAFLGFRHWDAIGAFIIALLIIKISIQMIAAGVKELIDTAVDEKTHQEFVAFIQKIPGVQSIHQLRTRTHGENVFIDIHIIVDPFISVSEGHYIGEQVRVLLIKQFKNVRDVTVHVDPEDDEEFTNSLNLPARNIILLDLKKYWQHLPGYNNIIKFTFHYLKGRLHVEIVMPISAISQQNPETISTQYSAAIKDMTIIASVEIYLLPE